VEGAVYVYLKPLPQEAGRLSFVLESFSAVSEDNTVVPLSVAYHRIGARDPRRQQLLALGNLAPGKYQGFSLRVKEALLLGEEEASLLVPEGVVRVDFPFRIERRRSRVVFLAFQYAESLQGGVSFEPVFSVYPPPVPPSGLLGFVSNSRSNNITVFDKKNTEVVGIISTGNNPMGMVFDQRSGKIYVAVSGEDSIEVVDALQQEVTNRIRLRSGDAPRELAISPDGRTIIVANAGSNSVSFIDASTYLEVQRISVGVFPGSLLMDRAGRRAYVFNKFSSTATILDIPTRSLVGTVGTDPGPIRGQFNRRGDRLYIIHDNSPYMITYLTSSLTVQRRDYLGVGANAIKVDHRSDYLYISMKGNDRIQVFDSVSFLPVDQIAVGGSAEDFAVDNEENTLLAVMPDQNAVRVVNLVSNVVASSVEIGEGSFRIVVSGEQR
jgi:YVTN family beta-propeller protein